MTKQSKAVEAELAQIAAEEKARVVSNKRLFRLVPDGTAKHDLRIAMLRRAFALLDEGETGCYACDAILEFMPQTDVDLVMERYFETNDDFDPALHVSRPVEPIAAQDNVAELRPLPAAPMKDVILQLWSEGQDAATIARDLGLRWGAVWGVLQRERQRGNPLAKSRKPA